jgi:hypothetical protein
LRQLADGVTGGAGDAPRLLGFQPKRLADLLAVQPAGVQERWFARLYFLKPLLLATLAGFWIASGVIGFVRLDAATTMLTTGGLPPAGARAVATAGGAIDVGLGALVLARPTARLALGGMIAVSIAYLAGASLWRPDLWSDPLGPLVKTLPAVVLAMVGLAVMDAR